MSGHAVRVLHLLRPDEQGPPANLMEAAGVLHLHLAGHPADDSVLDFGAHVISICGPCDHDARIAVERLSALDLPALGIGADASDFLTAHVTANIMVSDLATILHLLAAQSRNRRMSESVCRAQETGKCIGPTVDNLIRLLEHLMALRFPSYRERADRVHETCLWIANHLCLPPDQLRDLSRAARLREIGKLGLPDRLVFARRSERTSADQAAYDRYADLGSRVVSEIAALRPAASIVQYQLENFDGSGPAGLMAHQIPLGSRILRVASASVMVMDSENRDSAMPDITTVLEGGRGSLFDPLLVKLVENFQSSAKEPEVVASTRLVRIADLAEGMVLAEDLWSRTGVKIAPRGTRLTEHVLKILGRYALDPAIESVQVQT